MKRRDTLPNLEPGHAPGCTVTATYSGRPDTPPTVLFLHCVDGCAHLDVELERTQ